MPLRNKISTFCIDCGHDVRAYEGLSEKREVLGLPGSGWATKHLQCSFTPARRVSRPCYQLPTSLSYNDEYEDELTTMGMTESEFFGGDIGDKG